MAHYIIEYDKDSCIGAFACVAVLEKIWKKNVSEGKADLIGGIQQPDGKWILEFDDRDFNIKTVVESAQVCPVNVIVVKNKDTGEQLYPQA